MPDRPTYVALFGDRVWHLATTTSGTRAVCGRFVPGRPVREVSLSLVSCKACRRSRAWKLAQLQETG